MRRPEKAIGGKEEISGKRGNGNDADPGAGEDGRGCLVDHGHVNHEGYNPDSVFLPGWSASHRRQDSGELFGYRSGQMVEQGGVHPAKHPLDYLGVRASSGEAWRWDRLRVMRLFTTELLKRKGQGKSCSRRSAISSRYGWSGPRRLAMKTVIRSYAAFAENIPEAACLFF